MRNLKIKFISLFNFLPFPVCLFPTICFTTTENLVHTRKFNQFKWSCEEKKKFSCIFYLCFFESEMPFRDVKFKWWSSPRENEEKNSQVFPETFLCWQWNLWKIILKTLFLIISFTKVIQLDGVEMSLPLLFGL